MDRLTILLVDDDADRAHDLAGALTALVGPTAVAPDVYQALNLHSDTPFDAVVSEVALPGASGIDLLQRLAPPVPAVVLTWLASPAVIARALEAGAYRVLAKPSSPTAVAAAVLAATRVGAAQPAGLVAV